MGFKYNADEIFEMAVKIEQNGQEFYSRAAKLVEEAEVKKMLEQLAAWENQHEAIFTEMRQKYADLHDAALEFDLDNEAGRYLQSIADGEVFSVQSMDEELAAVGDDALSILNRAVQREKDAIVFFAALKPMVSGPLGADDVESIIQEEYGHIRYLVNKIKKLK